MNHHQKSLYEFSFEELDSELIARGAQKMKESGIEFENTDGTLEQKEMMERVKNLYQSAPPFNKELENFPDSVLVKRLKEMSRGHKEDDTDDKHNRGIIEEDDRMDFYELEAAARANSNPTKPEIKRFFKALDIRVNLEHLVDNSNIEKIKSIKKNTDSVAVICFENGLMVDNEFAALKTKSFKEMFNLCGCERFSDQPVAVGQMCTCFLVKEDIIATAGHFLNEGKVEDLRVVFGFKMESPSTAATKVPKENLYKGVKLIGKSYNRMDNAPDWALVKLDRKVKGQEIVKLSMDAISHDQPVYTLGHPLGLPLKFATGASVQNIGNEFLFSADLDVFMGNSGSPVFDMNTHEVIGIVVQGCSKDFRLVDGCWVSIIYPGPGEYTELSKCTNASAFKELLEGV